MTSMIKLKPRWFVTVGKRSKGGYSYTMLCPFQPNNVITGWRKGTKVNVEEAMNEVAKHLNRRAYEVPTFVRSRRNTPK